MRSDFSLKSPKTSSAGLALLLLAKKERLTPADCRLASSLRRAHGRRPRWFDDMRGASNDWRWFRRWWSGSIVSSPTPKAAVVLFVQSTYKNCLSCGVAPSSFESTREDSIVVVSVMACHLPAWPPVGTTGASLMGSSSTAAAWFLAIAHFGATVAGQSVMGLRPCSTSQCWLSIPMWNLNLQLRRIAIQKWRQQRPRICSVRSLCVASVALTPVFMPGLYSTAYRATFPAFLCGCL